MMTGALPARFGRFEVIDVLGRGAMGVVYRAHDAALGRTVAIKTVALAGDSAERDAHEARFLQEARAAGSISHPAIVTIYDVGREGDTAFIAMELLEGKDLRTLIAEGLTPLQSLEIASTVAEGLAHAHARGIVHRDVKPGNIMVLRDGRVKVMDFGIAHVHEPMVKTQTGVLLGSPQYMSPEQIVGQPLDHRADIFSLGLVFYEMLTGVKPFQGEDIPDLMFKVANLAAAPPSHLAPGLPTVVDFIVARALKKKPEERYAGAEEMAKDMREAMKEVAGGATANIPRAPVPQGGDAGIATTIPTGLAIREGALELRPSARFDSAAGLKRLSALPAHSEETTSRAGWTVHLKPEPRSVDPARLVLAFVYLAATAAAVAIALS